MRAFFGIRGIRPLLSAYSTGSGMARKRLDSLEAFRYRRTGQGKLMACTARFCQANQPIAEGDFNEKSAILLYGILAALFISIGMGGLFVIVYRSIS
jgi:hypothetical protein